MIQGIIYSVHGVNCFQSNNTNPVWWIEVVFRCAGEPHSELLPERPWQSKVRLWIFAGASSYPPVQQGLADWLVNNLDNRSVRYESGCSETILNGNFLRIIVMRNYIYRDGLGTRTSLEQPPQDMLKLMLLKRWRLPEWNWRKMFTSLPQTSLHHPPFYELISKRNVIFLVSRWPLYMCAFPVNVNTYVEMRLNWNETVSHQTFGRQATT